MARVQQAVRQPPVGRQQAVRQPPVGRQQAVRQPPVKQPLTAVSVSLLMLAMPVAVQLIKLWSWQRASMDWYGGLSPVR